MHVDRGDHQRHCERACDECAAGGSGVIHEHSRATERDRWIAAWLVGFVCGLVRIRDEFLVFNIRRLCDFRDFRSVSPRLLLLSLILIFALTLFALFAVVVASSQPTELILNNTLSATVSLFGHQVRGALRARIELSRTCSPLLAASNPTVNFAIQAAQSNSTYLLLTMPSGAVTIGGLWSLCLSYGATNPFVPGGTNFTAFGYPGLALVVGLYWPPCRFLFSHFAHSQHLFSVAGEALNISPMLIPSRSVNATFTVTGRGLSMTGASPALQSSVSALHLVWSLDCSVVASKSSWPDRVVVPALQVANNATLETLVVSFVSGNVSEYLSLGMWSLCVQYVAQPGVWRSAGQFRARE